MLTLHTNQMHRALAVSVILMFTSFSVCHAQGTWQALSANSLSWRFEDIFFVNENVGWAVDGGGQILKTSNAGQTWVQQFYDDDMYFRSVEFFDEQVGFAGTLSSALLRTDDGGATWVNINSSLPVVPGGICGMSVANDSTIYVTGIFYSPAYVMKSTDRGLTWTHQSMSAQAFTLVDVHFKNSNEGYLVGGASMAAGQGKPVVLRTMNAGVSWEVVGLGAHAGERAWKIQFLDENIGYVSIEELTPDPQYLRTIDGGATWTQHTITPSIPTGTVQGIGFLNENLGWIGGFSDLLFETTDSGSSWEYQPNNGESYNRFWRMNDSIMYVGGQQIYKYTAQGDPTGVGVPFSTPLNGHGFQLLGANPVSGSSSISIDLINNTFMQVSLHDANGKRIKVFTEGLRSKGQHQVEWNTDGLATGTYLLSLYTYHGFQVLKVGVK